MITMLTNNNLILHTTVISDLSDREKVLDALTEFTDEDFNGNNGEDYLWEVAKEKGFSSNQDYVIDQIRKSDIHGTNIVKTYLEEWLGNDSYVFMYKYDCKLVDSTMCVVSLAIVYDN